MRTWRSRPQTHFSACGSAARHLGQLMLGNDDVPRCDFVWRQPGLKRHVPSRLPDDTDDSASLRSNVVQLVTESHWLIADRIDSVLFASDNDPPSFGLAYAVRRLLETPGCASSTGQW